MAEHYQTQNIDDYIATLKRRRWQIIVPALVIFAAAAAVAVGLPSVYRSTGTILIEQQEIPADLVQSTVTSYAGERVQIVSQKVMTAENLGRIMERYDLYPDLRRDFGLAYAVREMQKDIELETISANVADARGGRAQQVAIAFSLSFDHPSPETARAVADEIIQLFLEENVRDRQATAQKTSDFLEQEAGKLSTQIDMLEKQLAEFKEAEGHRLPELMNFNLERMKSTEERLRNQEESIRALEQQRMYLQSELASTEPYAAMFSSTGERVMTPVDRLRVLEAEYVGLAARYSPTHPDRVRVERELAALRQAVGASDDGNLGRRLVQQQAELQSALDRYSEEHPDVKRLQRAVAATRAELAKQGKSGSDWVPGVSDANNPSYVQLQTRLAATEADLRSARITRDELLASLKDYEQRITESPQIEREYKTLTRDYTNAVTNYQDILAKLSAARLAEALETESRGERFSLIEPPPLPRKPYKPNRLGLLFLGFVLSVGGGMGHAVVREALDKRVYGPKVVQSIIGASPLAVVPYIETEVDRHRRTRRIATAAAAVAGVIAVGILLVHLFVMPLGEIPAVLTGSATSSETSTAVEE
nr:lipopolysaccharide biosynthesis protein [Thiocapsa sp. KS1]